MYLTPNKPINNRLLKQAGRYMRSARYLKHYMKGALWIF